MAQFSRESQPFTFTSPRQYKPFLRSDFRTRCAYCERPEEYLGGEEAFEVEHFRPKSKFPQLDCVYSNLYYACRGCNAHKSETWPSENWQLTVRASPTHVRRTRTKSTLPKTLMEA